MDMKAERRHKLTLDMNGQELADFFALLVDAGAEETGKYEAAADGESRDAHWRKAKLATRMAHVLSNMAEARNGIPQ